MGYFYVDESIHDGHDFAVVAVVYSHEDLTPLVHEFWTGSGRNPQEFEYKSSSPKAGSDSAALDRDLIHSLLWDTKLGLVVCPAKERFRFGSFAVDLIRQMMACEEIGYGPHQAYLDQNMPLPAAMRGSQHSTGLVVNLEQDSRLVGGIQVADHAAHTLSAMLLEEMGVLNKMIKAGVNSGYEPDFEVELGFALWASIRYQIVAGPNYSDPEVDDQLTLATLPVEGFGLLVAPSCPRLLAEHARRRFGSNYLGCIH